MVILSRQKSSHVHGQVMEDAKEEQGGDTFSACATGETGTEMLLFWCPVPQTTCPSAGNRTHKPTLSPQGLMVS